MTLAEEVCQDSDTEGDTCTVSAGPVDDQTVEVDRIAIDGEL